MRWGEPQAPINRQAAASIGRGREEFPERVEAWHEHQRVPFPTKALPETIAEDLTGRIVGRLTVIGLLDQRAHYGRPSKGARWVVRCVCGAYELRRSAVLIDPAYAPKARCAECERTRKIQEGHASAPPVVLHRHDRPKPVAPPADDDAPLMRLYRAVVLGSPDSTLGDLAHKSGIPRPRVREHLQALLDCGALVEREDGWYARGPLTSR